MRNNEVARCDKCGRFPTAQEMREPCENGEATCPLSSCDGLLEVITLDTLIAESSQQRIEIDDLKRRINRLQVDFTSQITTFVRSAENAMDALNAAMSLYQFSKGHKGAVDLALKVFRKDIENVKVTNGFS